MSLRLEMLQVARLAPKLLGESAALVRDFFRGRQNPDGGFQDRAGRSDLYYTVFGIDGLIALQEELPRERLERYLLGAAGSGEDGFGALDFVHLCCLARCWAALPAGRLPATARTTMLQRIEAHRASDGGYHQRPGQSRGTIYACYLAWGAYQDLNAKMPDLSGAIDCVGSLRAGDGGYSNEPGLTEGMTTATAAAATLLRHWAQPVPREIGDWLLARAHPEGGFLAMPRAPIPDLLSTATALHALTGMQTRFDRLKEPCLDLLDTLWDARGGFHGHWADDALDVEYTSYGLLALGHLSL
jgi:prenyltransferase beta subunit